MRSETATNENEVVALYLGYDLKVTELENADWRNAQSVQINRYWSGEPAPAGRKAEARLLWSDKALHVRYVCHQAEPLIVSTKPQIETKAMGLWDRDVCEIFIAPNPNAIERYFELEAAPTGEWLDVAIQWKPEQRESDWGFESQMTTAAEIEKDRNDRDARSLDMRSPATQGRTLAHQSISLRRPRSDHGYLAATANAKARLFATGFGWLVFGDSAMPRETPDAR
jgi:hypothetical protein